MAEQEVGNYLVTTVKHLVTQDQHSFKGDQTRAKHRVNIELKLNYLAGNHTVMYALFLPTSDQKNTVLRNYM